MRRSQPLPGLDAETRALFTEKGWRTVVGFQTRNVPHTGHEWLMKGAWFEANADAILVNPVIGEKRAGDPAGRRAALHGAWTPRNHAHHQQH